jgi:hypothetical protein
VFFNGVTTANTADFDVEVRDLTVNGTVLAQGIGSFSFGTSGSLQVSGALRYLNVAPTNSLSLFADQRLEVLLPTGSISLFDQNSSTPGLAGTLNLVGRSIFAANGNLLGLIRSDPNAASPATVLKDNSSFTSDGAFIFADRAVIAAGDHLLTQNTGVGATFSGIIVGPGGLLIRKELDFGTTPLRVVTFGGRKNLDGTFTTNDAFFGLVDFGTTPPATVYTAASTLNDCNIVLNQCGSSDMIQSNAANVIDSANSSRPGAARRAILRLSAPSPVSSCLSELRRKNSERLIQIAK